MFVLTCYALSAVLVCKCSTNNVICIYVYTVCVWCVYLFSIPLNLPDPEKERKSYHDQQGKSHNRTTPNTGQNLKQNQIKLPSFQHHTSHHSRLSPCHDANFIFFHSTIYTILYVAVTVIHPGSLFAAGNTHKVLQTLGQNINLWNRISGSIMSFLRHPKLHIPVQQSSQRAAFGNHSHFITNNNYSIRP